MSNHLFLQRAARIDLKEAYKWYELHEVGLGERFLVSVEKALERSCENPHAFPIRFDSFRRVRVDTFPYLIFFSIDKEKMIVHAVFHTSRNPEVLRSRLRGGQH